MELWARRKRGSGLRTKLPELSNDRSASDTDGRAGAAAKLASRALALVLLVSILFTFQPAGGQQTAQTPDNSATQKRPDTGASEQANKSQHETKISPQEAQDLLQSVDEILKFASKDSALPIKKNVKRRLTTREEVVAYLREHMSEDEDAQRLRRSELVLKKFGLLPRNFDLQTFLVALLREQVAGYYDPKTKTVNLLDWLDSEAQRPVLAHELTHALQDQSFNLEKWLKSGKDLALEKKNPTSEDINKDEVQTVRQAIVEGQAMAVLLDYMLAPTGQTIASEPRLVEAMKEGMLVGTADSPEFHNAPPFLKEVMTFPYRYGVDFVGQVLVKQGKEKAFSGMFKNPPTSTRQIMEPQTYLSGERIDPMPLPDFSRLAKDYNKFDVGSMGEFDVAVLIEQYAGGDVARKLYPQWRGGYYYAAYPKGDPNTSLDLIYVSRWASAESAAKFAAVYASQVKERYRKVRPVSTSEDSNSSAKPDSLSGSHTWLTEDGDVIVAVQGDTVFVSESFDDATADRLRSAVMPNVKSAGGGR